MNLLCKLGIHVERFLSCNVAGGSRCPCGKKSTPPIIWPRCKEAQRDNKVDLQTATNSRLTKRPKVNR